MTDKERKVYDKDNPSANGRKFIPLSSNAIHYVHHPKVRPNMLVLYAILVDKYNVNEGFAFPSLESLALEYGMSYNATSDHVEVLKEVGLIDYPEKGYYVPLEPLSEAEFFRVYPEAWNEYKRLYTQLERKKSKDKNRLRKWREDKYAK